MKLVVRFETLEKHSTNVSVERKLLTQTLVRVIVRIGSLAYTSVSYRLESTLHRNVYAVHDVAESTPSLLRVNTFIYNGEVLVRVMSVTLQCSDTLSHCAL